MIIWTHSVLGLLYGCVLFFCICTCSAHLSMFQVERRSGNRLNIILFIIIIIIILNREKQCLCQCLRCKESVVKSIVAPFSVIAVVIIIIELPFRILPQSLQESALHTDGRENSHNLPARKLVLCGHGTSLP